MNLTHDAMLVSLRITAWSGRLYDRQASTVDRREAAALERVLAGCGSAAMIVTAPGDPAATPHDAAHASSDALARWDDNGNARITCKEARRHGIAPVPRRHPAYIHMYDRDGDGVVCE